MPKKRKNGLSPGRVPAQAGECEALSPGGSRGTVRQAVEPNSSNSPGYAVPGYSGSGFQNRDEVVRNMQEMFSHLDPGVIHLLLSEADFNVENAMDALLELSDAAEDRILTTSPPSGFAMAAALLDRQPCMNLTESDKMNSEAFTASDDSQQNQSPETTHLTEELDYLLDQELRAHSGTQPTLSSIPLTSLPTQSTETSNRTAPDLQPPDVKKAGSSSSDSTARQHGKACRVASPVNELSFGGPSCPPDNNVPVDFSHLAKDSHSRSSAFKAYSRPGTFTNCAVPTVHPESLHTPAMFWNIKAPAFQPRVGGPVPHFSPVMKAPIPWTGHLFNSVRWQGSRHVSQAPLKPSATVPKSWTLPPRSRLILEGPVLVLLRGAPGSGKTTLASAMLEHNPGGVVLSTDEYFIQNGAYHYNPDLLGEAHAWNHVRAKEAFEKGYSPIIIDNTNMQCWEMKPYVALALKHKYRVLFREPETWWKTKPRELEKRTRHGVTKEKIRRMLEHQDRYVSVQNIMDSQPKPLAVFGVETDVCKSNTTQQPLPGGLNRPDLVGDSRFGGNLSSSLPDVSSVGQNFSHHSARTVAAEGEVALHSSKESVSSQKNVEKDTGLMESCESLESDLLLDGESLDWELDSCIPPSGSTSHDINKDHPCSPDLLQEKALEEPVPFSESIGQRVRRGREHRRFAEEEDANLAVPKLSYDSVTKATAEDGTESEDTVKQELLNFVGDWPAESLEQRLQRSQRSATPSLIKHIDEETTSHVKPSCSPNERSGEDFEVQNVEECPPSLATDELEMSSKSAWKSLIGSSTDPGKDDPDPQPQSPSQELRINENENTRGAEDTDAEMQKERTDVQTMDLKEFVDSTLSFSPDTSSSIAEGSKERRKGSGRKMGKSCRLALTFTNQSPSSAFLQTGSPAASPQLPDLMLPPQLEPLLTACICASVQTDPQDFSLLWRINQKTCELDCSAPGMLILEGNPLRFVPKTNEDMTSGKQEVPYRVCHEKGSQVEEGDLGEFPLKQHNLEILRQHFKHVPIETLEDLYEKCHHDMDWTTNLLLDSGEQLFKDDEDEKKDAKVNSGDLKTQGDHLDKEEKTCASQVTRDVPATISREESRVNVMMEQTSESASALMSVVPGTSRTCSPSLSADNVDPFQSEESQASEKDELERLDLTDAVLESMSRSSSLEHPDQPYGEPRAPQDSSVSESIESQTGNQKVQVHELAISEQAELASQNCEKGLEGWIEEEELVQPESGAEDRVTEEEVDAITRSLLAQLEEMEGKKEEERSSQGKRVPLDIQMLELKLPTELALQLTELFGPVGISPGEFSPEDCSVLMDLNLAKLLHQKWKETIQERQRQATLSYHLLQQSSVHWGETQPVTAGQRDSAAQFLIGADGYASLSNQSNFQESFPFMDHWNVSRPAVSLRNIMIEEQVMQESLEKSRLNYQDLEKKDAAAMLKEKQLFTLFPTIDRHFLRDIFRDHNYSLEQTELFLHTLLDDGPVKNVVAEVSSERTETHRAHSKERKWKQKNEELAVAQFQDTEDPEYEDFRTEATLQRRRQQECFDKAAEAYRQGRKDVASFYAQQRHLHGQKMKEANHRAAVQIFKRVNATLLPQNVLDLHGLHVEEALFHLQQVITDKTSEWHQGLGRPQLSIITGRGNHSQGGVARLRPAVLDYLKRQHYRYSEPKPGLILVTLH